ncbi:hypothetical protein AYO20_11502 [Fonsecaea nubica]|uniref:RING-type domain-containing protein n=1 Tax=Fonsecaea nubica TaxID=856822 RepID=A0A178BV35_9EURO|nr:hypothetical protein AYO20_11502 [Fonsecaea nubica]OAL20351.1 hypothetical protein AYO20_11502 [Fonsecaea nubica]
MAALEQPLSFFDAFDLLADAIPDATPETLQYLLAENQGEWTKPWLNELAEQLNRRFERVRRRQERRAPKRPRHGAEEEDAEETDAEVEERPAKNVRRRQREEVVLEDDDEVSPPPEDAHVNIDDAVAADDVPAGDVAAEAAPDNDPEDPEGAEDRVIKHYQGQSLLEKRSQYQQKRDGKALQKAFKEIYDITPMRIGKSMTGKTIFEVFVELYEWAEDDAKRSLLPKLRASHDADKALTIGPRVQDEIDAVKRYLLKIYDDEAQSVQGMWNQLIQQTGQKKRETHTAEKKEKKKKKKKRETHMAKKNQKKKRETHTAKKKKKKREIHTAMKKKKKKPEKQTPLTNQPRKAPSFHGARVKCGGFQCPEVFSAEQFGFLNQRTLDGKDNPAYDPEAYERLADNDVGAVEGLEACPFCPYLADYTQLPDQDAHPIFYCENPECSKISCRKCRKLWHEDQTCDEAQRMTLDPDRQKQAEQLKKMLDDAMSAAVIRTCNECGIPLELQDGCNKVVCTNNRCFNYQCYYCGETIIPRDYQAELRVTDYRRWSGLVLPIAYGHFAPVDESGVFPIRGKCPKYSNVGQLHCFNRALAITKKKFEINRLPNVFKDELLKILAELWDAEEITWTSEMRDAGKIGHPAPWQQPVAWLAALGQPAPPRQPAQPPPGNDRGGEDRRGQGGGGQRQLPRVEPNQARIHQQQLQQLQHLQRQQRQQEHFQRQQEQQQRQQEHFQRQQEQQQRQQEHFQRQQEHHQRQQQLRQHQQRRNTLPPLPPNSEQQIAAARDDMLRRFYQNPVDQLPAQLPPLQRPQNDNDNMGDANEWDGFWRPQQLLRPFLQQPAPVANRLQNQMRAPAPARANARANADPGDDPDLPLIEAFDDFIA